MNTALDINKITILVLIYFLSGCSNIWQALTPSDYSIDNKSKTYAETGSETRSPFVLKILDELHDGKKLFVQAEVVAKTDWPANSAEINLIGISKGQTAGEKKSTLDRLLKGKLPADGKMRADTPYEFVLNLPSNNLSNYQIELNWWPRNNIEDQIEEQLDSNIGLEILDMKISKRINCSNKPCKIAYTVSGMLNNTSQETINFAKLGVGFVFVEKGEALDLSSAIPENEEEMTLKGLNLEAGQARAFNVKIKKLVIERPDGAYTPLIRVLESSS
jgi:hypothetical protein